MPEWIAIGLTIIGFIVTVSVMWGKLTTRMDIYEQQMASHTVQHREHYAHAADTERHWTERERDQQNKQLDRIEELLQELLTPRAEFTRYRNPPQQTP